MSNLADYPTECPEGATEVSAPISDIVIHVDQGTVTVRFGPEDPTIDLDLKDEDDELVHLLRVPISLAVEGTALVLARKGPEFVYCNPSVIEATLAKAAESDG